MNSRFGTTLQILNCPHSPNKHDWRTDRFLPGGGGGDNNRNLILPVTASFNMPVTRVNRRNVLQPAEQSRQQQPFILITLQGQGRKLAEQHKETLCSRWWAHETSASVCWAPQRTWNQSIDPEAEQQGNQETIAHPGNRNPLRSFNYQSNLAALWVSQ